MSVRGGSVFGRLLVAGLLGVSLLIVSPAAMHAAGASPSSDSAYITALFHDFLDRAPSDQELSDGVAALGEESRSDVVSALANSPEWVAHIVIGFYENTLGRGPDEAGLAFWIDQITSGDLSVAEVGADFYASEEYFLGAGQSNNTTWVTDLYRAILHRDPDSAGLTYWAAVAELEGRLAVTYPFFQSMESAFDRVDGLYTKLLHRGPDADGANYWSAQIVDDGDDIGLAISLASSDEYYDDAATRSYPSVTTTGLPDAVAGSAYSAQLAATGGDTPYTWSGAGVPPWMTIGPDGKITGTPPNADSLSFTVIVTDKFGVSAQAVLTLQINAPAMSGAGVSGP